MYICVNNNKIDCEIVYKDNELFKFKTNEGGVSNLTTDSKFVFLFMGNNIKSKLLSKTLGKNSYWALNKQLVKSIGLEATLILQHIIDLQSVFKKDEIFQSQPDMANELGITEYAIKNRIVELSKSGLINVIKKGVPAKNYYSTNDDKIMEILDKRLEDVKSTDLSVDYENDTSVDMKSTGQSVENTLTGDIENTLTITNNTPIIKTNNSTNNTTGTETPSSDGVLLTKQQAEKMLLKTINSKDKSDLNYQIDIINEDYGGLDNVLAAYFSDIENDEEFIEKINSQKSFILNKQAALNL